MSFGISDKKAAGVVCDHAQALTFSTESLRDYARAISRKGATPADADEIERRAKNLKAAASDTLKALAILRGRVPTQVERDVAGEDIPNMGGQASEGNSFSTEVAA